MKLHLAAFGELLSRYGRAFALSWKHRKEFESVPRSKEEAEFLPAVLALQDTPGSPAPHIAMWAIISLLLLAVIWAYFGKIDIVAVAQGKVVPAGNTKIIQAPSDAQINEIRVDDGQQVKAGDVLLVLNAESAQADVSRLTQALASAKLESTQGWPVLSGGHRFPGLQPTHLPQPVCPFCPPRRRYGGKRDVLRREPCVERPGMGGQ